MNKKILHSVAIAIMLLLGACSSDEVLPEVKPEAARTISITASLVDDDHNTSASVHDNEPTTRVSLTRNKTEGKIEVRWEKNDQIDLAFVQDDKATVKVTVTLTGISNEGKTALFSIPIPEGFETGAFTLYGVYGGGGIELVGDKPVAKLPTGAGSATSLNGDNSVQSRKDAVIYFKEDMKAGAQTANVIFKHLGSFFSITLKNIGEEISNLKEARLVGINNTDNLNWAYNASTANGKTFDLATEKFQDTESGGNYISFAASTPTVASGGTITFWGWYPPLPTKIWPELQLQLINSSNNVITTIVNSKSARTAATDAGKNFYFYALSNKSSTETSTETKLAFTDKSFIAPSGFTNEIIVTDAINLSQALTSAGYYANNTSNLTALKVTTTGNGVLRKADFNVMKLNMPNLTYVDLSGAKCMDDTEGNTKENTIPTGAFGTLSAGVGANTKISTIILPTSITEIGRYAFKGCTGLAGTLSIPSGVTSIGENAFMECTSLSGNLTLPAGLKTMGNQAFQDCTGFNGSLIMPANMPLAKINQQTFFNCNFTGTLTIPHSVKTIEFKAFYSCEYLTGLVFNNDAATGGIVTIVKNAFQNCKKITGTIIFPSSLTDIGQEGFCTCLSVDAFRFPHTTPITYTDRMLCRTLGGGERIHYVEVPQGSLATYKDENSAGWNTYPDGYIREYTN